VLPIVRGQAHRCRDCKHRFWAGVEWGRVVLGTLTAMVVAFVIVAMVVVRENQTQTQPNPGVPARRVRRVRPKPLPQGLPPLSKVPSPDADRSGNGDTN